MVDLELAKKALQDALGNADEWYAVEFARDYGAALIAEIENLNDRVESLRKIDSQHSLNVWGPQW